MYGTMNNNKNDDDGNGILIFGHGTLSGDKLPHPNYADDVPDDEHWRYHGINIDGKESLLKPSKKTFRSGEPRAA